MRGLQGLTGTLQTVLAVVFVFGLLIASHELGHFTVAKLSGVAVLEFSLGMGPKLLGFKKGETDYSLRLFPIGGYVRMLGEEGESSDPRAFCNKSPWKRLPIILAGAFMNFVIAVLLFTIVWYNMGVSKPIVSNLEPGYPAAAAGVKVNDRITYANDKKINKWEDFLSFVAQNKDNTFKMTVERDNKPLDFNIKPVYNKDRQMYMIGITSTLVKGSFKDSLKDGLVGTFSSIKQMLVFIGGAFRGKVSLNDVGGPVAIVKLSGEAARVGIWSLLYFTAFLSINLGVLNLIPFPALDGGWVIILLIEGITGRKIDENKIGFINLIGFTLLIGFAILVTFKDIGGLIK